MAEPALTLLPALLEPGAIVAAVDLQERRPNPAATTSEAEVGALRLAVVELLQGPARYTRGAIVSVPYALPLDPDVLRLERDGWACVTLTPGARWVLVARATHDASAWSAVALVPADAEPAPAAEPSAPSAPAAPAVAPRRTQRLRSPTVLAARRALELAAIKEPAQRLERIREELRGPPASTPTRAALHLLFAPGAYDRATLAATLAPLLAEDAAPWATRSSAAFALSGPAVFQPAAGADAVNARVVGALAAALVRADPASEPCSTLLRLLAPCVTYPFAADAPRTVSVRRALLRQVTDPPPAELLAALAPRAAPREDGEHLLARALADAWRDACE